MQKDLMVLKKPPENNVFVPGPVHCENAVLKYENIWNFFPSKYLKRCFNASGQLVPKCLFSAIVLSRCSHLGPKYILKVKLLNQQTPNILSEIIKTQENGSKGPEVSTGTFTKGQPHSALYDGHCMAINKPASQDIDTQGKT